MEDRARSGSARRRGLLRRADGTLVNPRYPAIGMESEFNVVLDGQEIDPRAYWGDPLAFIGRPLLQRERSSYQLPTGGAVYFDRGVIEVVTPIIELERGAPARAVRSIWEQIAFVRDRLTEWQRRTHHDVHLKAYSSHYNISFEVTERRPRGHRIQDLAWLLAHLLPVPVAVLGTNRRSTGVGVRPRGNRIEVTADFTPDPGSMVATATLVAGIVREAMTWPTYRLEILQEKRIPLLAGLTPGKHTTRKGWLAKDHHFPLSPFTCDIDAPLWPTSDGRTVSLRRLAWETARAFRLAIARFADPFSYRLMFQILEGRLPCMLDLEDRPASYEDVGVDVRWGQVVPELAGGLPAGSGLSEAMRHYVAARDREREAQDAGALGLLSATAPAAGRKGASTAPEPWIERRSRALDRRGASLPVHCAVDVDADRRAERERRAGQRRRRRAPLPFPDRRLARSAYETVFLKLVGGEVLRFDRHTYTPVGMRGWYHAVLRREDGRERLFTVDQLLERLGDWRPR